MNPGAVPQAAGELRLWRYGADTQLSRARLNMRRSCVVKPPETPRAFRFHLSSGQFRNLPACRSSSASWNRKSSLP